MAEDQGRAALVAGLDASPASRAVAAVAAELAARLGVRIEAVYVEEAQWLNAAALPCTRWVARHTGAGQALTVEQVELSWRAALTQVRAALTAETSAAMVPWSVQVARGEAVHALVSSAHGARVLTVGACGWQGEGSRLGSVARALVETWPGTLALVPARARRPRRWLAVIEDAAAVPAVLHLALALARDAAGLHVLAVPGALEAVRAALTDDSVPVAALPAVPGANAAALRTALRRVATGVVIGRGGALAAVAGIERLLASGAAAVLLVGEAGPPAG